MHSELLARLEAATGPDWRLDMILADVQYPGDRDMKKAAIEGRWRPTASIDAALTLVLEGCEWSIDTLDGVPEAIVAPFGPIDQNPTKAATPALAIVIAALRAKGDA